MKRAVFISADNIYSPVGATTAENFQGLREGITGVRPHTDPDIAAAPFVAALLNERQSAALDKNLPEHFTRFEKLISQSIADALARAGISKPGERTILIISSTKGNISQLESGGDQFAKESGISLVNSAEKIGSYFGFVNEPLIVSNACISGLLAIITGKRLVENDLFDTAVVAGADEITEFIFSGFQSFQALSDEVCKPFDASRKGINLGEAAATVVLTSDPGDGNRVRVSGGAVRNDANHISGPSRTGEELYLAIRAAMNQAGLGPDDIGFISAHGTATNYNDEMEAKAISLANLRHVPVNSLKGYFGHTLGAAGIVETIITKQSMLENLIIPTPGYSTPGVSQEVNICSKLSPAEIHHSLKTASGFGGCNAALTLSR